MCYYFTTSTHKQTHGHLYSIRCMLLPATDFNRHQLLISPSYKVDILWALQPTNCLLGSVFFAHSFPFMGRLKINFQALFENYTTKTNLTAIKIRKTTHFGLVLKVNDAVILTAGKISLAILRWHNIRRVCNEYICRLKCYNRFVYCTRTVFEFRKIV